MFDHFARSKKALVLIIAFLAMMTCLDLNKYYLWSDEAGTADFAMNLLKTGHLFGWDGRNILAYDGGDNLDRNLDNHEFSPLHSYVAALGIGLFGQTTWAARLPFWILGLFAVYAVRGVTEKFFEETLHPNFPPLILATSIAYQLYLPQCRYYALVLFFTVTLLYSTSLIEQRSSQIWGFLLGALSSAGLVYSNPLAGASMIAAIAFLVIHSRFRTKDHCIFVGVMGAIVGWVILHYILGKDVLETLSMKRSEPQDFQHFITLMRLQFKDMGTHEYVPFYLFPFTLLPFLSRRLSHLRLLSGMSLTMAVMLVVVLVVIALISPQHLAGTEVAEMRYALPIIILGSFITASSLTVIADGLGRLAGLMMFCGLIFSHIFYGSFTLANWAPTDCSFCKRLVELSTSHPSGGESYLSALASVPPNSLVEIVPDLVSTIAIYYRPDLLYVSLLDKKKELSPELKKILPSYVYKNENIADYLVIPLGENELAQDLVYKNQHYNFEGFTPYFWMEWTRPEISRRVFQVPSSWDKTRGVALFKRKDM